MLGITILEAMIKIWQNFLFDTRKRTEKEQKKNRKRTEKEQPKSSTIKHFVLVETFTNTQLVSELR